MHICTYHNYFYIHITNFSTCNYQRFWSNNISSINTYSSKHISSSIHSTITTIPIHKHTAIAKNHIQHWSINQLLWFYLAIIINDFFFFWTSHLAYRSSDILQISKRPTIMKHGFRTPTHWHIFVVYTCCINWRSVDKYKFICGRYTKNGFKKMKFQSHLMDNFLLLIRKIDLKIPNNYAMV